VRLKVPVWVQPSGRRIVPHLPADFPGRTTWQRIALAVGVPPA
jgi:hypothetical protein